MSVVNNILVGMNLYAVLLGSEIKKVLYLMRRQYLNNGNCQLDVFSMIHWVTVLIKST